MNTLHFTLREELHAPLRQVSEPKNFASGTRLFQKGDLVQGVFLIEEGRVALSLTDVPELSPRIVGAGALLGLPSTIGCRPYSLAAEALEPVKAGFIPREAFMKLLEERPDLCLAVVQGLAWEITESREEEARLLEEHFGARVGHLL